MSRSDSGPAWLGLASGLLVAALALSEAGCSGDPKPLKLDHPSKFRDVMSKKTQDTPQRSVPKRR